MADILTPMLAVFSLLFTVAQCYLVAFVKYVMPYEYLPKKELKGKKVLITGAGSGLGKRLAEKMAAKGAVLVLWDLNKDSVEHLRDQLHRNGVQAYSYHVDLCDAKQIVQTAKRVLAEIGKIDILVNNAGICTAKMILNTTEQDIDRTFGVNVKANFYTVQQFLPLMLEKNEGHIVTVASAAGKMASAGLADYSASKHGAVGFHDSLVAEIQSYGKNVKTTLVCPYYFQTWMFDATGATTNFPSFLPFLDAEGVAQKVFEAVETEREYVVTPGPFMWLLAGAQLIPYSAQKTVGEFFGVVQDINRFHVHKDC